MEARAAGEAGSARAGLLCLVCLLWRPASASTHLSTLATGQGLGVAAAGVDTRPCAEKLRFEISQRKQPNINPTLAQGKGRMGGNTQRGQVVMAAHSLPLVFLWVSLQIPDTEINQK